MRRNSLLFAATLALLASTACGLEKTSTPDGYSGPSEFGLSLTLGASPEVLPRDGRSQSIVTITVRDSSGNPLGSRVVRVWASAGRLSESEVTTGPGGTATVMYTAPGTNEDVAGVTISAIPAGSDFANAVPRDVSLRLIGSSLPVPSFTWTPVSPARFALTSFDASATTVGGTRCGTACTYAWDFNREATASGPFATHRFQQEGTHQVRLAVSAPGGTSATVANSVTVTAGVRPTAVIRFSPTSPCINATVFFNASESTGANGAAIAEYEWDFGNGTVQHTSSSTVEMTYNVSGAYVVLVTVVDSNGLRNSASVSVTVRPNGGTPALAVACIP